MASGGNMTYNPPFLTVSKNLRNLLGRIEASNGGVFANGRFVSLLAGAKKTSNEEIPHPPYLPSSYVLRSPLGPTRVWIKVILKSSKQWLTTLNIPLLLIVDGYDECQQLASSYLTWASNFGIPYANVKSNFTHLQTSYGRRIWFKKSIWI